MLHQTEDGRVSLAYLSHRRRTDVARTSHGRRIDDRQPIKRGAWFGMPDILAVYGTLRPTGRWHDQIASWRHLNPEPTQRAIISGRLVDTGHGYPGLLPGSQAVSVDLFHIPPGELGRLDRFEDVRPTYGNYRRQRTIAWLNTIRVPVWTYFYRHSGMRIIQGGDWLAYPGSPRRGWAGIGDAR